MSDLKLGQIAVQGMKRVPEKYRSILDENLRVSPGDLVIGMSGSIGKPCFNLTGETFLLNQRVGKFVPHSVDKNYLAIVLQTLESSFLEMSAGSGIKNLSTKQIKDAELPLPPALEQKRIVTKVDELMTLCDQLEHSLIKRDELAKKIAVSLASEIAA
jgi:type I restriction enzyme S subunit